MSANTESDVHLKVWALLVLPAAKPGYPFCLLMRSDSHTVVLTANFTAQSVMADVFSA